MSYQSISPLCHRYLQRDYLGNRSEEDVDPIGSYRTDVSQWARTKKTRMHQHCKSLLKATASPVLLVNAIDDIGRRKILGDYPPDLISNEHLWGWLRDLQKRVLNGSFQRGQYKKYKIPKPGTTEFRTIEVPPDETRILARNLSNLLTPILDPDFYDLSMGFRPKRSPSHCVLAAESLIEQGMNYMVSCDIRDAFGTVPKQRMLQILRSRLHQSPAMKLIEDLLDRNRPRGIPQGLAISPICLNVYLDHLLDHWWGKNFPGTVLVRYADDLAIFCNTQESAIDCYTALRNRILAIGMQIKETQPEAIYDLASGERVDWVGFNLRWVNGETQVGISEASWCKLEARLLEHKHSCDRVEFSNDRDVAAIGYHWLEQKALGVSEAQVPAVAEQIRQLAGNCGLDMSRFIAEDAEDAWLSGQRVAQRAQEDISQWLPQPFAAS